MSSTLDTRIIDGDGHITEDEPGIIARMEPSYRRIAEQNTLVFPPLDHLHAGRAVETPPRRDGRPLVGPKGWLNFLDDVGIDWTVLYPTKALAYGNIVSLDYAAVVCRAYNDWLAEFCQASPKRLMGVAMINVDDVQQGVEELQRCRKFIMSKKSKSVFSNELRFQILTNYFSLMTHQRRRTQSMRMQLCLWAGPLLRSPTKII